MRTSPPSAAAIPAMALRSVVFPELDGPTRAMTSPENTLKLTSSMLGLPNVSREISDG